MSDTTASLQRKIKSAGDLQSVVRTMKALSASSIGQYEKSVRALGDYNRTVELGLSVLLRDAGSSALMTEDTRKSAVGAIGAVVFGSGQGLVGQFNDVVADYAIKALAALPGKHQVWAVGERVHARLAAMERADNNIDELLETFQSTFHRLRQSGIDAELFDVISGFEAQAQR